MHAFELCSNLDTVNFPNKMIKIHDKCFDSTPWLTAKRIENPLVIINGDLIDGKTASGDITIPDSVKYVSPGSFSGNSTITSVVFPNAVKEVGDNTFFMCSNLRSIEIKGVTYIGMMAFDYCNNLSEVKISNSLTKIDEYAFSDINAHGTITFYGTQEQWNSVEKPSGMSYLDNATMIYDNSNPQPVVEVTPGDANCDGRVTISDVVATAHYVLNRNKHPLTEQGLLNADVDGDSNVTKNDALIIQKMVVGLI